MLQNENVKTNTIQPENELVGGGWLINETHFSQTFFPEDFSEEQKMVLDMCHQFIENEITPILPQIDSLEPGLMPSLIEKAGNQGLLGVSIPEKLGGLGKDFITSTLVSEGLGSGFSFSVAASAHVGIGTLPILYFGNQFQKEKYIPKLASGEWKGSYGLTEPNSGSDALSIKTTATLDSEGKHYLLNGQKCWITNGGFADIFTVFAKIDGDKFTAFIIEKDFEGFTKGLEEHKMGIKGSSTVQLYFQDCKVPVENVLGEKGRGHIIAFNILNIGRLKLNAAALGGAKKVANIAIDYANHREQFKTAISNFGAIQYKLAEMAIKIWIAESALYRSAYLINQKEITLQSNGLDEGKALLGAAEEFAIECAILKVFGSEVLDYVVDEAVQIHGGNGFSEEYSVSRAYRDSRINRIFEGTNEINRLLVVDMLIKKTMKGKLDLMKAAINVQKELLSISREDTNDNETLKNEKKQIKNFKKAILLVAGTAVNKLNTNLEKEQEIVMNIADMIIEAYHAESALMRLEKLKENKENLSAEVFEDIFHTYIYDASFRINKAGIDALNSFIEGDELRMLLVGLKRFTQHTPFNIKAARRRIANALISKNSYFD